MTEEKTRSPASAHSIMAGKSALCEQVDCYNSQSKIRRVAILVLSIEFLGFFLTTSILEGSGELSSHDDELSSSFFH